MRENELFSNQKLKQMIVPLFLEQLLVMFVGIADTLVISYAGEAASQLLICSTLFSVCIGAAVLIGNEAMLRLLFGKVEKPVMDAFILD